VGSGPGAKVIFGFSCSLRRDLTPLGQPRELGLVHRARQLEQ